MRVRARVLVSAPVQLRRVPGVPQERAPRLRRLKEPLSLPPEAPRLGDRAFEARPMAWQVRGRDRPEVGPVSRPAVANSVTPSWQSRRPELARYGSRRTHRGARGGGGR